MKYLFILMTVLNSFFFLLDAQTTSKKELINCNTDLQKSDSVNQTENKLIGEWTIGAYTNTTTIKKKHSTISTTSSTNCNSCPTVTFKDSMTATIIYPVGKENIKWKVKDNILTIINIDKNKDRAFSDSIYEMTYTQKDKYIELELTQIDDNYSIILRRKN